MATGCVYCVQCGYGIEADCQFCPQCGEPKRTDNRSSGEAPSYGWMQDASTPATDARPTGSPPPEQPQYVLPPPPSWPPPQPPPQVLVLPSQQSAYGVYHPVAPLPEGKGRLSTTGMVMGIGAVCLMLVGLIPCLGWVNWFTLLFAPIANIVSMVAIITERRQVPSPTGRALIGLILAFIAAFIGGIRLVIGGGCI